MRDSAILFVIIGSVLLAGLGADAVARRWHLPRVTLLLLIGFLIGPACFDLLPESRETLFYLFANVALSMVGFLLGERLGVTVGGQNGREVIGISIIVVLLTAGIVFGGLVIFGIEPVVALLLGGIAAATDPAAAVDVVRQLRSKGRFTDTLMGIVAIDDAWGLLLFSLLLAAAQVMTGASADGSGPLLMGLREMGGAVLLGGALGVVMAYLTGRIAKGEPTLLEALGFVFLASGLSMIFEVSFILTAMVMGAVVSRLAKHHRRPFHAIEDFELPFMILFFVMAGAALDLGAVAAVGTAGLGYIVLRLVGRVAGGWLGGKVMSSPPVTRQMMGLALVPQAGVALGMALLAAEQVPEYGEAILQITIGSTVVFEFFGPFLMGLALQMSGEAGDARGATED